MAKSVFDNGGIIGKTNNPTFGVASGVWNLNAVYDGRYENKWLSAENTFKTTTRNPLDIFGWCGSTGHNACTVTRDTTISTPYGGSPLKMAVTGNDPHIGTYNTSTWNIAAAANGQVWQVRVLAKASVATTMQIFIFGANSSGVWAGAGTGGINLTVTSADFSIDTTWGEYSHQITMNQSQVAFIQTRLDGPDSGGTGQNVWFDGLQVYRLS